MNRLILLVFALFFGGSLFGQAVSIVKAKKAIESKQFEKAVKICEKGMEKDRSLNELLYIRAWAELEMAKDPKFSKELNYTKACLKSIEKAEMKDKDQEFRDEYSWLYKNISDHYLLEGLEYYRRDQFSKAIPVFQTCFELSKDTIAYTHFGLSFFAINNFKSAFPVLTKVSEWMHGAWEQNTLKHTYNLKVYQELAKYYADRNNEDSSLIYIEYGLDLFPNDIKLTRTALGVVKNKIEKLRKEFALNAQLLRWVNIGLTLDKNDYYFLDLQNDYYLQSLNYVFVRNDLKTAKEIDSAFFADKKALAIKNANQKKDVFLTKDSLTFINECLKYFMAKNTEKGIVYFFYKWYPLVFSTPQINEQGLESILKNPPVSVSKRLIFALINHSVLSYPKNVKFKNYKQSIYNNWKNGDINESEFKYLFNLNDQLRADFPKTIIELNADKERLLVRAIDTFLLKKEMEITWSYYNRLKRDFPKNNRLDTFGKKLAILDFELRYKNTRIYNQKVGNEMRANTGWDGYSKKCNYGTMPDSTIQKMTDRINYFRQNAGVRDIVTFNKTQAQKCQEASVMYSPVGVFTREPTPETHLCFSQNAAEAAMFGQAIKDNNPAIAATVLMSDEKSEELYNRQYILAPNARYYGFGSSENNSVFWMVHPNDRLMDSVYYTKNFISWPPQGYCPKMFLFTKWSFSMMGDLSKATVEISSKSLDKVKCNNVKIEKAPMLPFSTLVFSPNLSKAEFNMLPAGETIYVTVTINPKKIIQYKFTLIDPK